MRCLKSCSKPSVSCKALWQTVCFVCCHLKKTILLLQHHRSLDSKVKQKNMLLMLLSLPQEPWWEEEWPSFSLAAHTRAIYHFGRPFIRAKCFTMSLLLVARHKRHVTCRNITDPVEQRECPHETQRNYRKGFPHSLRWRARVRASTQSPGKIYEGLPS